MPKIPLYNEQSSIGTAQGVTINPQYAVNLASAESQNDELRIFQDVLGMGKEFVNEYKKNKYDSDMAKSKQIESDFQSDAKIAWVEAQTKGQTATEFKNTGLSKLKADYDQRYSEAGFFGDSLVDARQNFNIKYAEEEKSVDLNIANEALNEQIDHFKLVIKQSIANGDEKSLKANTEALARIIGREKAEAVGQTEQTLNVIDQQRRDNILNNFKALFAEATIKRQNAVDDETLVSLQEKAYEEQNRLFNEEIDNLINANPEFTSELSAMRTEFLRNGENEIVLGSIATNAKNSAKKTEIDNLIIDLDKLNGETDLATRNTSFAEVEKITEKLYELGYYANKQAQLDAVQAYEQEGQYVTAHSILSTTSNYDEFNTEWAKVEQANKEGRYTAGQYAQLQVLKRASDRREHKRIYLDPIKSIQDNPENWTEQKINDLDGISEEQRQTMQSVYKLTLTESLYKTDPESAKHYAAINQSIFEMQQEVLKGHYFKLYTEAKTDKEREEITKEANSRGVTISRPDMAAFGNVTEQVDKILKEIYKENDEGFTLPKNLIIDLTQNLYSIAGNEQTYTSGNNPIGVYEHRMYKAFNEIIMPRIASMGSNEAQINAIAHMREQMAMRVQEHLGKEPKPPYRVSPNVYGVSRIDTTQTSPTFSEATNERIIAYQKQTEEWKQSDDGIAEFLHISLYPMISRLALEGLQAQTRNQISNNLTAIADEAYRSVRNDPIVGQKFYGQ